MIALGVRTIVIGVGTSWSKIKIQCIVAADSIDEDIVYVSEFSTAAFNNVTSKIHQWLCQPLSFILTEVKPHLGFVNDSLNPSIGYWPLPFVEFYTNIASVDFANQNYNFTLDGNLVTGWIDPSQVYSSNASSAFYWEYNQYLVLFDDTLMLNGEEIYPRCHQCLCTLINQPSVELCAESIYIGCHSGGSCVFANVSGDTITNVDIYDWQIIVNDNSDDDDIINQSSRQIMNISWGMGTNDWPDVRQGFTYELLDKDSELCDSEDGHCWRESCYVFGTPGYDPIVGCGCSEVNCRIFNDTNAVCANDTCVCSADYCYSFWNGASCFCIPPPTDCFVTLLSDDSIPYGDAVWDAIDSSIFSVRYQFQWIDDSEHVMQDAYTLQYQPFIIIYDLEHDPDYTFQQVRSVINFGDNPNTENVTETAVDTYSEWTTCLTLTMNPTSFPTYAPTYALPTIDWCFVQILSKPNENLYVNLSWATADISGNHTYNDNQFDNDYLLWIIENTEESSAVISRVAIINETFAERTIVEFMNNHLLNASIELRVGAIIHAVNNSDLFLEDLYERILNEVSVVCDIITYSPTPLPTAFPTYNPTNNPSLFPTLEPTKSPTFSCWQISDCEVFITDSRNREWNISRIENIPEYSPNSRAIYVYVDGEFQFSFVNGTLSPQMIVKQIETGSNITLQVVQDMLPAAHSLRYCPIVECVIRTLSPTKNPSMNPTQLPTSVNPTLSPTGIPSFEPTLSPTYEIPIVYCAVTFITSEAFKVQFEIPSFEGSGTPDKEDSVYRLRYNNTLVEAYLVIEDDSSVFTIVERNEAATIEIFSNSSFWIRVISSADHSIFYGSETLCDLLTLTPTINPSRNPSLQPTPAPTFADPGVYIYDSSMCVLEQQERYFYTFVH